MIPILQNIKNLKSISFLSSKPLSNRTGSSFLSTTSGNTVSLSNQYSAVMVNPFPKIPSALYVGLHITTYTTTMGITVNTSAKSVDRHSLPANSLQPLCVSSVRTVAPVLLLLKTDPFSAYINASIQNVLTISTTLKTWIRSTLLRIMAKTNINSITSTVNSLWISSRWTYPLFRKMHLH